MLHVQAKIVDADGAALDDDEPVAPVKLMLQSLFSQVDVSLNDRVITPSAITYPYRAIMETLLSYGPAAKSSHLTSGLFYKDSAERTDFSNPTVEDKTVRNEGLYQRFLHAKGSKMKDLIGPIHADIFFQDEERWRKSLRQEPDLSKPHLQDGKPPMRKKNCKKLRIPHNK